MSSIDKQAVMNAGRAMLRPFVSLLLKCGLTWREFSDLSKSVFVEVASDDYGIGGRPTNVSRVSILTGVSRKEVKRQRDLLEATVSPVLNKTSNATRLLSRWHQDPDFLDTDGEPRKLDAQADGNEFPELCRRYAVEVPATTMLKELKRVGAVEESLDGYLTVKLRYYMPTLLDPEWLMNAGDYLADLTNTINYNLEVDEDSATHFLGRAMDPHIPSEAAEEFQQFVELHGQQFLEAIDAWLDEHQCSEAEKTKTKATRLGVGVFHIQGDSTKRRID